MKTPTSGYILPFKTDLDNLNLASDGDAYLIADERCWYIKDSTLSVPEIDIVNSLNGKFIALPTTPDISLNSTYQSINIATNTYTLDFTTLPTCIELNILTNTSLTLLNLRKFARHFLKINFNGFIIENLTDILHFSKNLTYQNFNTNLDFILCKLEYIKDISTSLLFAGTVQDYINYYESTGNILFNAKYWNDFTDSSSFNASSNHNLSIVSNIGLLLNDDKVVYSVGNNINLNETDFEIELFIRFITNSDYGSILSKWDDSSQQFWIRIDNTKTLLISFKEGSQIINLSYDLTATLIDSLDFKHIIINRLNNIYRLFINGELVNSAKSKTFMINSSANLVVGKLENSTVTGGLASISFPGYIREIKINTVPLNNYKFKYTYPKDIQFSNNILLYRFDIDIVERKYNYNYNSQSSGFSIAHVLYPRRSWNSVGKVGDTALDKQHHFQLAGDSRFNIPGDVTLECFIKNIAGNTRGTILYWGDGTNYNVHWGIYDKKLRFQANNGALDITGTNDIPDDIWTHLAYVRSGNNHRLYVNGTYNGGAIDTNSLNNFGTSVPICIKKSPLQDNSVASINTSLYPSKSQFYLEEIRVYRYAAYNGTNTAAINFLQPGEFSVR